jgi:exopolyphosphatase/guanosine-5'-triphosphate,3'-diphosphate pyrophosphatase
MSSARRLVIDIGTNSVLALLADVSGKDLVVISDRRVSTRLGEGLTGSGRLSQEAMIRTADAISLFMEDIECDSILLIGTEALRTASNASEFADLICKRVDEKLTVLTGHREAELTYRGALYRLNLKRGKAFVVDVGGGSTEFILGKMEDIIDICSIPIGALSLKESSTEDRLMDYYDRAFEILDERLTFARGLDREEFIATGGTITSIAAIALGLEKYDPDSIHGYHLSVKTLNEIASRFENQSPKERKLLIPFDPERADLILPGAGIFLAILGILEADKITVSVGGLRFGAALHPERLLN